VNKKERERERERERENSSKETGEKKISTDERPGADNEAAENSINEKHANWRVSPFSISSTSERTSGIFAKRALLIAGSSKCEFPPDKRRPWRNRVTIRSKRDQFINREIMRTPGLELISGFSARPRERVTIATRNAFTRERGARRDARIIVSLLSAPELHALRRNVHLLMINKARVLPDAATNSFCPELGSSGPRSRDQRARTH